MANEQQQQKNLMIGGGVVLALGALAIVYATGTSSTTDDRRGCALTASGAAVLAQGLSKGRNPGAIVASIGGGALAAAECQDAINRLSADPSNSVELTVETADGPVTESVTGQDLRYTPPASGSWTCYLHEWALLEQMCLEGRIGPPS